MSKLVSFTVNSPEDGLDMLNRANLSETLVTIVPTPFNQRTWNGLGYDDIQMTFFCVVCRMTGVGQAMFRADNPSALLRESPA